MHLNPVITNLAHTTS